MVYVFLANGFEETEALVPVDVLRRAGLSVCTVGVGSKVPVGSHGIPVVADITEQECDVSAMQAMILPGGMPGTRNLEASDTVQKALETAYENKLPMGAICAAPSVLGHKGYLQNRRAVCFPGFEDALIGAIPCEGFVVTDENITTAKGAGVALEFGLEMVEQITAREQADRIRSDIQCP